MKRLKKHLCIPFSALVLLSYGCGSTSTPTPTDLTIMMPVMALTGPASSASGTGVLYTAVTADIAARLAQTTAAQCYSDIDLTPAFNTVTCFGPAIGYDNHPNGAATNASSCSTFSPAPTGCLSGGDVGAWSNADGNEACLVAQHNFEIRDLGYIINNALKFAAGSVCAAQLAGVKLPVESDGSVDIAVKAQDSFLFGTVTSARLSRGADLADGKATYNITYNVSQGPIRFVVNLTHSTEADKSKFKGKISGYVDLNYSSFISNSSYTATQFPNTTERRGFSAVYDYQANVLKIVMNHVMVPTSVSSSSFLNATNDITYTAYLAGTYPTYRKAKYLLSSVSTVAGSEGVGTAYTGWQDKPTDGYARLLKMQTNGSTGFGYFGFSAKPGVAGYGSTLGGMFCNWAGPGATTGAYQTTNVQSQTFTLASGEYGATTNALTYAPTNSCDTSGGTFKHGTIVTYPSAAVGPTINNSLVTQTANGTITAITEPVYP